MSVPVPLDVVDVVVRLLRRLLTETNASVAAGVKVSTEIGRGQVGGPPSLPWLLVAEDGHTWVWPAVQRAVIRLTCWHHTPYTSKALAGLALGLLCVQKSVGAVLDAEPITAPLAATDPYTDKPLAMVAVAVRLRTPPGPAVG